MAYKKIIADGYSASSIIKNISLLDPSKKFIDGKTLIFFDEITEFPESATSLKFFKEDGRFDVICSGSMLGVNHKRIESNSVGYKTPIMKCVPSISKNSYGRKAMGKTPSKICFRT